MRVGPRQPGPPRAPPALAAPPPRPQLRARSVASQGSATSAGLLSPAELAELQQPRDAPGHGLDGRSSKEMKVYRVNSPAMAIFASSTCRPHSGRSCKSGAAERGDFSILIDWLGLPKK